MRMKDSMLETTEEGLVVLPSQIRQTLLFQLAKYALHSDGSQYDALCSAVNLLRSALEEYLIKNMSKKEEKEYKELVEDFISYSGWVGNVNSYLQSVKTNKSYAKTNSRSFRRYSAALRNIKMFEASPLMLLYLYLSKTNVRDYTIPHHYIDRVGLKEKEKERVVETAAMEMQLEGTEESE